MRDSIHLLLGATVVSVLAWGVWHYLGSEAQNILGIVVVAGLAVDNFRLRRQLKNNLPIRK